jgi:pSer/pThr/pTyr-binding forkhead associated (FHA) protein
VKSDFVVLSKEETVVGRDRGDLKYPEDNYLSKKHARFYRDPEGRLCIEDLGALNGTYIRLRGPVKLEHRDVIFLGRHAFRFEVLEYEEKDDRTLEGDPLTRVQGAQGTAPRARLVKRQEEGFRGLPFFFGVQRYVLGRTDGTHNFQRDDLMSRRHAALFHKDGAYCLEDLGSQNGTFLRLSGPRALEAGDVVKMGDQYFKLV